MEAENSPQVATYILILVAFLSNLPLGLPRSKSLLLRQIKTAILIQRDCGFVFMWYNNIVIISYDEGRILYGKTIFVDNEHRRKHTVLS